MKRMRGDQIVQEDDLNRAWNVFGMCLECVQQVISLMEGQGGLVNESSILNKGDTGVSPFITAARTTSISM